MLLKTQNVMKKYGTQLALQDLSMSLEEGKLIAYIGTNGAGKSTTIRILSGLMAPTSGQIYWKSDLKVGMVFQSSVLDSELSVTDNLNSRKALYHNIDKEWVQSLLTTFGINQRLLKQEYGQLSGGQKRKVDIVRALMHKPDILFLDEPTAGLDVESREQIWKLLNHLKESSGLTIFLTTHYLEEAENADMTYILDQGKVIATGTASDLKAQYGNNHLIIDLKDEAATSLVFDHVSVVKTVELLEEHKNLLKDFTYHKATMNDVFLNITRKDYQGGK